MNIKDIITPEFLSSFSEHKLGVGYGEDTIDVYVTSDSIVSRGLPKWPQMLTTGEKITKDQAEDIILRTDSFMTDIYEHSGGNNREFNQWYRDMSGIQSIIDKKLDFSSQWNIGELVRKEIGYISTEYVTNYWASSSFIFGPHGWCHPDGTIKFIDNVGKYPSISSVAYDWHKLATKFPYISVIATLMSGESCEDDTSPVASIIIHDGKIYLTDTSDDIMKYHDSVSINRSTDIARAFMDRSEQGLDNSVVIKYASIVKTAINKVLQQYTSELTAPK
jgi:hypothetical protein